MKYKFSVSFNRQSTAPLLAVKARQRKNPTAKITRNEGGPRSHGMAKLARKVCFVRFARFARFVGRPSSRRAKAARVGSHCPLWKSEIIEIYDELGCSPRVDGESIRSTRFIKARGHSRCCCSIASVASAERSQRTQVPLSQESRATLCGIITAAAKRAKAKGETCNMIAFAEL